MQKMYAEKNWYACNAYKIGIFNDPAWWRREGNQKYRALCMKLVREGKYDEIPRPGRDNRGYYW